MTTHDELPTVDEMLAYTRGELPPHDEARVREALVRNPDLARALVTPFPEEDAQPGDPDYLSPAQVAKQWEAFQAPVPAPVPIAARTRGLTFWRASAALAAALAVVFGGLLFREHSRLTQPRVTSEEQVLLPDGGRGNGEASALLSGDGESYLLVTPLINQSPYEQYRLEIVDVAAATPRSLWSSPPLRRGANDTFAILVPRAFLPPGRYQVVLHGLKGGKEETLATYTMRVAGRG